VPESTKKRLTTDEIQTAGAALRIPPYDSTRQADCEDGHEKDMTRGMAYPACRVHGTTYKDIPSGRLPRQQTVNHSQYVQRKQTGTTARYGQQGAAHLLRMMSGRYFQNCGSTKGNWQTLTRPPAGSINIKTQKKDADAARQGLLPYHLYDACSTTATGIGRTAELHSDAERIESVRAIGAALEGIFL